MRQAPDGGSAEAAAGRRGRLVGGVRSARHLDGLYEREAPNLDQLDDRPARDTPALQETSRLICVVCGSREGEFLETALLPRLQRRLGALTWRSFRNYILCRATDVRLRCHGLRSARCAYTRWR